MGAGHPTKVLGAERGAQQVVGGFGTGLGAHLTGAEHAANGSQPRPGMSLLQPSDVGRDQAGAGLDTAVIAIDRGMANLGGVGGAVRKKAGTRVEGGPGAF